jgi:Fe(3+) dicitrate transport protein
MLWRNKEYSFRKCGFLYFIMILMNGVCFAQTKDTSFITNLNEIKLNGYRMSQGTQYFNDVEGAVIYAGKKTSIIHVDSIDVNKAINNTRQILAKIPGVNIVESEAGGFVANGIGMRGLNPVQSLEMNVRQNGYNIAADVYGYNETYYLPPMEAVSKIEVIKGAASIQFGSQLGGMVNYVLKEGPANKKFQYSTMQTAGSNGLLNSYHAAGGTIKKWSYFSFLNYRKLAGWRPNSQQDQLSGYGKISYQFNRKLKWGIEYSLLRNKVQMPGGLSDDQFEENSKSSVRTRNWLKSPWNVVTTTLDYNIRPATFLQIKSTFFSGERSLVWFSGLPSEPDSRNPITGIFLDREIDREFMKSFATEMRLSHIYRIGKMKSTLATGIRFSEAGFDRKEDAPGNNHADLDLSITGPYAEKFHYTTSNIAVFMENCFHLTDHFSITPGWRLESLASEIEGEREIGGVEEETEEEKSRQFSLLGLGMQYSSSKLANVYANISQAYRPVDYAQLLPFSTVTKVDPNMKDPKSWNVDFGVRGTVQTFFNYDVSLFYLNYSNRIGLVNKMDENGKPYTLRTNVDKSIHQGIEIFAELNITRAANVNKTLGDISIYNSFAYTRARYANGVYKDKQVEYAPELINRLGILYSKNWFTTSLQLAYQSKSYTDAANTERSDNPVIGKIPAYSVVDWSISATFNQYKIKGGVNNISDKRYFTQRTDEYPGPGIIPSIGRSYYVGIGFNL